MYAITRDQAVAEVAQLGVRFESHIEAARHTNLAAWARLAGYQLYAETVWYTLRGRGVIVYPVGLDRPLDPARHWRIIAHELVHWHRQPVGQWGCAWWCLRYAISQEMRAREELEAHAVDIITGRKDLDIGALVDGMRSWYRLPDVDPSWMRHTLARRLTEMDRDL